MAEKNIEIFLQEVAKNEKMRNEFSELSKDFAEKQENQEKNNEKTEKKFFENKIQPAIKKYGFELTYEDFKNSSKLIKKTEQNRINSELDFDALSSVAGGKATVLGVMACPLKGNLKHSGVKICSCWFGGAGGKGVASPKKNNLGIVGACACAGAGTGAITVK
ncbi:MAG: hypothetical protein LBF33_03930 [Oscillospiraceae bacterium]|jgi:hypothetical protein|nr:hypothetical protein [Oscillospiraceae bacterium]